MAEDIELLEAAREGNREAIGRIFDLYAPVLFRYAFRLCHDRNEADRIVGDVFARLLEHLSKGNGPRTNLRAYLYQITYHQLVEHVRDARRVSSLEEAISMPDGEASVAAQVESRETIRAIENAVMQLLTAEQRYIILLRFAEGLSLSETAQATGKSANAVSVLQARALERIRKALRPKFGFHEEHNAGQNLFWMPA